MTARRRGQRCGRAGRADVISLGQTGDGVDAQVIQVIPLPYGHVGRGVWVGDGHILLVSSRVPYGQTAQVARHLLEQHAPTFQDETWDSLACTTRNCEQARLWLQVEALGIAAGGL